MARGSNWSFHDPPRQPGIASARTEQRDVVRLSSKGELAVGLEASEPFGVRDLPSSAPTLSRVPLAGGAPREVLDRVTWADWSPDGSDVAVVRRLENSQRVEFPIGTVLYETNNNLTHLRVSPGASGSRLLIIPGPIRSAPVLW